MNQARLQDVALLALRVVVGLIMVYAGAQKVLGVFGGEGIQGTISAMHKGAGILPPFAVLAMAGELLGGLGVLVGAFTRLAAFGVMCTMAVASYVVMSMPGALAGLTDDKPDGMSMIAFPLVLFAASLAILLLGGGSFALDAKLFAKKKVK